MTFIATRGGQLVAGGPQHLPDGTPAWGQPWAFRCDDCGRLLPYQPTINAGDRRLDRDQARVSDRRQSDRHVCGDCETGQMGLSW